MGCEEVGFCHPHLLTCEMNRMNPKIPYFRVYKVCWWGGQFVGLLVYIYSISPHLFLCILSYSKCGALPPESCFFSLICNTGSFMGKVPNTHTYTHNVTVIDTSLCCGFKSKMLFRPRRHSCFS